MSDKMDDTKAKVARMIVEAVAHRIRSMLDDLRAPSVVGEAALATVMAESMGARGEPLDSPTNAALWNYFAGHYQIAHRAAKILEEGGVSPEEAIVIVLGELKEPGAQSAATEEATLTARDHVEALKKMCGTT